MNIAFLIRTLDSGGAERAASALANAFSREGHKVTIYCLVGSSSYYPIDADVTIRYLNNSASHNVAHAGARVLLHRFQVLRKAVKEEASDILICMSWSMSLYGIACTRGISTICVGTERSNPFILNANRITTFLRRFAAKHCDGFVCQTERARSFFPHSIRQRTAVIPNGIFNPLVSSCSVPNKRSRIITACGRLDRNKGFDVLLQAFARVHRSFPDYTLCIYGEGVCRDELQKLTEQLELTPFVNLPGSSPDAIFSIAESSVFVLSSRSEGMPNALIEAMAVGVPCVSTCCEMGPTELIENGTNGLLVPVDDPDAMADAIERILHDSALSEMLSANSLSIRNTHSMTDISAQWLQYFRSLMTNHS